MAAVFPAVKEIIITSMSSITVKPDAVSSLILLALNRKKIINSTSIRAFSIIADEKHDSRCDRPFMRLILPVVMASFI